MIKIANKREPEQCRNITEIRSEIDLIDQFIVKTIGKRFQYVKTAAKFKTNEQDVKAEDRFRAMLKIRRKWAVESGLDADVIEKIFKDLINYFINAELSAWEKIS